MAKFYVGKGLEKYIRQLGDLEFQSTEMTGKAVYKGAGIVADAIKKSIDDIPERVGKSPKGIYKDQREGLKDGLGIAPMRNDNGYLNVKIGFDGYNSHVTKSFPKGQPNAMVARAVNSGTSFAQKDPFVDKTVRKVKQEAETAMQTVIDLNIKAIMEDEK